MKRVVHGGGIDRTLRTTQWTRASSNQYLLLVLELDITFGGVCSLVKNLLMLVLWAGVSVSDTYVISSFEEQTVDALASGAEEGRRNLR